ncbi:hypothetical protein NEOLEDRAFT_1180846 [Neolentinus lepideus HHB14362 ss-1]|uniref:Actin-like ATPase domain-containing protein n=1 Tax=Neolentinus lepideus HHB14362 ss-1 TaxID=1314782 RepID=A0A165QHD5_9AGAM|nr:hypothetical protein NEOLEDRAFT_1180846 [Neolentinus lepideus HHB14362 ss-1]
MSSAQFRKPYKGPRRKLVLSLDVGTTCSGVSYTLLDPGEVPKLCTVTKFPGQTDAEHDSKVPSVLYYDVNGVLQAVGQEAENRYENGEAEDNEWVRVEWFKLHLRPKNSNVSHVRDDCIPQLPAFTTITTIVADFLMYLYECAKEYIRTTHAAGDALLRSLDGDIDFVMGHPNGWGGLQEQMMRIAAVQAGLVPDMNAAENRIQFVTEGEASLYYCLENGLSSDIIKTGNKIMVVDAGGGTIDLSSYLITETRPIKVEEVASPGCRLQGAVFVNQRASSFLFDKLKGSIYDDPQDIDNIVHCFEKTVKRRFKTVGETAHIRFGTRNDNDPEYGISRGILKLTGTDMARLFDPSLEAILAAIQEQRRAGGSIKRILFVGGFAASDYLFDGLRRELGGAGTEISRPDGHINKAVADGAVAFYMDHVVSARMTRTAYGVKGSIRYDPSDLEHIARKQSKYRCPSGSWNLPKAYHCIVPKDRKVRIEQEFTIDLCTKWSESDFLGVSVRYKTFDITTYDGSSIKPRWTDDVEPESYRALCTVHADISKAVSSLKPLRGHEGQKYYCFGYKVVLKFGLAELKAQIAWMENGEEKRSPASIVYLGED